MKGNGLHRASFALNLRRSAGGVSDYFCGRPSCSNRHRAPSREEVAAGVRFGVVF
jgi:hypothetical protein